MTGLHTVLTTEPLHSDISFGLVLFPKGYDSREIIEVDSENSEDEDEEDKGLETIQDVMTM